jgi:hypothetical protein
MSPKTLLLLAGIVFSLASEASWSSATQRCHQVFQQTDTWVLPANTPFTGPDRLRQQDHQLDYNGTSSFAVVRAIHRIFNEFHLDWLRTPGRGNGTHDVAEIRVPAERWSDVFPLDYESVLAELQLVDVLRVDSFQSGQRAITREGPFLLGHEIQRNDRGETLLTFRFDARMLEVIEFQMEPSIANFHLESGVFRRRQW